MGGASSAPKDDEARAEPAVKPADNVEVMKPKPADPKPAQPFASTVATIEKESSFHIVILGTSPPLPRLFGWR